MKEKNEFKFKSKKQREELKAALKEIDLLMIILSIEGKKNLIFMISIMMKEIRMMIVIISFVALRNNMIKWCKKVKISCIKWKIELRYWVKIIMITAEMMTMREFIDYI